MNFNSAHQVWSLWQYRVYPETRPSFLLVKDNCARFGRLAFGSASQMRIAQAYDTHGRLYWEIAIRTDGHPVHERPYVEWMHDHWRTFFRQGFGQACEIQAHARLEAGDRQDGRPADQLIVLPLLQKEP
jgi:hypothetical protein